MDRAAEVRRLDEADMHIGKAEQHITAQKLLIEELRARGQDTSEAERLLTMMQEVLDAYRDHRRLIVEMIDQIDAGLA